MKRDLAHIPRLAWRQVYAWGGGLCCSLLATGWCCSCRESDSFKVLLLGLLLLPLPLLTPQTSTMYQVPSQCQVLNQMLWSPWQTQSSGEDRFPENYNQVQLVSRESIEHVPSAVLSFHSVSTAKWGSGKTKISPICMCTKLDRLKHSLSAHLIWSSQQTCEICRTNVNTSII